MTSIVIAAQDQHGPYIRELFWEYLQWANIMTNQEFGVNFDIASMLEADMNKLDKFMPPKGRLLLGFAADQPAGIACLKQLTPQIGEIKRMYVRPMARRQGLGRALLDFLIKEARGIGYERLRLDSARFMKEAHQLYRAIGFQEIQPYPGSEIPREFQQHWIFMEMSLAPSPE